MSALSRNNSLLLLISSNKLSRNYRLLIVLVYSDNNSNSRSINISLGLKYRASNINNKMLLNSRSSISIISSYIIIILE